MINNNKSKSLSNNNTVPQIAEEESLLDLRPELNDVDDDNLKEIAGLMKNVLDE